MTDAVVDEAHPWPGLAAFDEAIARYFFGRRGEERELFERVSREKTTLFFGRSGLGKTSLLQASLAPRLREAGYAPAIIRVNYDAAAPPAAQAAEAIMLALRDTGADPPASEPAESLWAWLHRRDLALGDADADPVTPAIIFDQFEEVFTLGLDRDASRLAAQSFLGELADLIENRPPAELRERLEADPDLLGRYALGPQSYSIVIALREDYLPQLEGLRARAPSLGSNRMRLTPMEGRQALQAVIGPARSLVDDAEAREIVHYVGSRRIDDPFGATGAEPADDLGRLEVEPSLLSLFCQQLNEKRLAEGAPKLTHDLLEASRGSILDDFYESALADQPAEVRAFVEDRLLTPSGMRDRLTRATVETEPDTYRVPTNRLDLLVGRRLLRVEERGRLREYELIHDRIAEVAMRSRTERRARDAAEAARRSQARRRRLLVVGGGLISAALALAVLVLSVLYSNQRTSLAEQRLANADLLLEDGRFSELVAGAAPVLPATLAGARRTDLELVAEVGYALEHNRLRRGIAGFAETPSETELSPDGTRVLAVSKVDVGRYELGVWDLATGRAVLPLGARTDLDCCASFGATDDVVVLAKGSPGARKSELDAVSLDQAAPPRVLARGWPTISTIARDPPGGIVLAGAIDGSYAIWDLHSWAATPPLKAPGRIRSLVFCPDQRWLALFSDAAPPQLVSYSGAQLGVLRSPGASGGPYPAVAGLSGDCGRIVTATAGGLAVWNTSNPRAPRFLRQLPQTQVGDPVRSLALSPTGKLVVTASGSQEQALLWDTDSGRQVAALASRGRVQSVAFSPSGDRIATAAFGDWVQLWGANGEPLAGDYVLRDGVDFNRKVMFGPGGQTLITVGQIEAPSDPAIRIWDVRARASATGSGTGDLAMDGPARDVQFSPDGRRLAASSMKGRVALWDASTLRPVADQSSMTVGSAVFRLAFDRAGRRLAAAAQDGSAEIWDLSGLAPPLRLPPVSDMWATGVGFDPTGARLVITYAETDPQTPDGEARICAVNDGRELGRFAEGQELWDAAFNGRGTLILTGSESRVAQLWDAATLRPVGPAMRHGKPLNWAAFDPAGDLIATASDDGTARIWRVADGRPMSPPLVGDGLMLYAAFDPGGKTLATATSTGRVYFWDARSARLLGIRIVSAPGEALYSVNFDRTGRRIAVGSHDGFVHVLEARVDPNATVRAARALAAAIRPAG
ncbi:MAG TPA: WD40 repeat domain-containing protein [Caulobacteraceae bacterium]|nr:WD40 repeat domain-containing protein [Caulobacteraceae bacterium]